MRASRSDERRARLSDFATLLRDHRRAAGLTQESLAERAHLSVRTISGLESGAQHTPYRETLRLLIAALALSPADAATFAAAASRDPAADEDSPAQRERDSGRHRLSPAPRPLPIPPTTVIGREVEVASAGALLAGETRLLTLCGPAGVGKTRLALAVASSLRDVVEAACFVDLAPVWEPGDALPAIARAIGVRESEREDLRALVVERLSAGSTLLLLDNFEQILPAATVIADLLAACAGVKALVTSRAMLGLRAERVFAVPPLPAAWTDDTPDYAEIAVAPAVRLFVERAAQVSPGFVLTPENAPLVAAICSRLDGLPLAIELAAARVKLLSLPSLLDRLEDRLTLLSGGPRDLPDRQQTLIGALDWSYNLLSPPAQAAFRRLSVFVAGAPLDDAEALCAELAAAESEAVALDLLTGLVEQSLLTREKRTSGDVRLRMLETLREYAWTRLAAHGEVDAARRTQARLYLRRAEEMERLPFAAFATLRDRLDEEIDNLRAVLRWSLRAAHAEDVALGLRLAAELGPFWYAAGHISEGGVFLQGLLARVTGDGCRLDTRIPARAYYMAGWLALDQGECGRAVDLLSRSVALYRQTDDRAGLADALNRLGDAALQGGHYADARQSFAQSLSLRRLAGDDLAVAGSLNNLGAVAMRVGDFADAEASFDEALSLYERADSEWGALFVQSNQGDLARRQGEFERAERLYGDALALARSRDSTADEAFLLGGLAEVARSAGDLERSIRLWTGSLTLQRRLGNCYAIATCHLSLGHLARELGRYEQADNHYTESLSHFQRLSVTKGVRGCAVGLAEVARLRGDLELAARLSGMAAALGETLRDQSSRDSWLHEQTTAALGAALDERRFQAAWNDGYASARGHRAGVALGATAGGSAIDREIAGDEGLTRPYRSGRTAHR